MRPLSAWHSLPRLVRFLIANGLAGFALSALFVAGLVHHHDEAAHLLLRAAGSAWPAVALWFFTGLTFGAAQIAMATMLLAHEDERPGPRGGVPVRVGARSRR
ncbi:MAG TPA: hypothetical protein VE033_12490 [Acetobacteraceae bacterium]|nr:hypothetical protein [Acetobacteraceae bacterium]